MCIYVVPRLYLFVSLICFQMPPCLRVLIPEIKTSKVLVWVEVWKKFYKQNTSEVLFVTTLFFLIHIFCVELCGGKRVFSAKSTLQFYQTHIVKFFFSKLMKQDEIYKKISFIRATTFKLNCANISWLEEIPRIFKHFDQFLNLD